MSPVDSPDIGMQAVVCHGPRDYRLETVRRPRAGPRELVIRVQACGICASDCKCHNGAPMFWGGDGQTAYVKPPVTPGHEFFGVVVEMGDGAGDHFGVSLGEWVIAEQIVPCERCRFCRCGQYWMCEVHNIFGFQKDVAEGGMAEFMRIPANARVHAIPDSLSVRQAALIEPLACAIHTVNRADIQLDDIVVIAGCGTLGLLMTQVARLKTPRRLIVVDPVQERLDLALTMGADLGLNPRTEDAVARLKSITGGYGCDVYIESTGAPQGVVQGLQMIRKLGRFVEFSVFGENTSVDWSIIGDRKELDVRGAHLGPYCYPTAIDLLARGLVSDSGIVTHEFALADWEQAFSIADSTRSIKVLLLP